MKDSGAVGCTKEGLENLARIVRNKRGHRSYTAFQSLVGLAHATIWKIEKLKVKSVELSTLVALSPHVGYTPEELQAIVTGRLIIAENMTNPEDITNTDTDTTTATKPESPESVVLSITASPPKTDLTNKMLSKAEDFFPYVDELPHNEAIRLAWYITSTRAKEHE